MRGVTIIEPGRLELTGCEPGPPGPGSVRIRLLAGGLCGSDLSAYLGTSPMVRYPRVIGHELIGVVSECGDSAADSQWLGQTVAVEPYMQCGECYACRIGRYNCCSNLRVMGVHIDGGMQDEFVAPVHKLVRVPERMDVRTASLAEPLTISLHAIRRADVREGERVLIFGCGTIGLLAVQVVKAFGAQSFVVDVREDRLERARRVGADAVWNAGNSGGSGAGTDPELVEAVRSWTCGEGAHVAVEASGAPSSNAAAIDCLANGGRIVLVGWNKTPISVDTVTLMRKEATVFASRNSACEFAKAFELLESGFIAVDAMVTHRLPLERAADGLQLMQDANSGAVKVLLEA